MKRHLRESKMKVSELDFEPTLKAVEKIADRLGLKWDNVKQGTIEQRGDYTFTVTDIPNHGINQFSVHKSNDGQSLIVSAPDTAKMDVALEGKNLKNANQSEYITGAKRMQELAGISTKINFNLPENTGVKDFAKAVAYELRESYGTHNYDAFFRVLQSELQEDDSDLYPGTMGDEMSAPTSI